MGSLASVHRPPCIYPVVRLATATLGATWQPNVVKQDSPFVFLYCLTNEKLVVFVPEAEPRHCIRIRPLRDPAPLILPDS